MGPPPICWFGWVLLPVHEVEVIGGLGLLKAGCGQIPQLCGRLDDTKVKHQLTDQDCVMEIWREPLNQKESPNFASPKVTRTLF